MSRLDVDIESLYGSDARRDRRMVQLITLLWTLSLFDLLLTLWAHLFTPFYEVNPIARALLSNGLIPSLVLMKMILTLTGATIFWRLRSKPQAEIALWGIVLVYALLAFRWSNYTIVAMDPVHSALT